MGQEDFFAGGESHPALKFTEVGQSYRGVIIDTPEPVERPNLNNGQPEQQLPVNLEVNGEPRTLWVRKGFLSKAIKDALVAANASGLQEGGTLAVKFKELRDTGKPQPAKVFGAKYEPPAPVAVDPAAIFGDDATTVAADDDDY